VSYAGLHYYSTLDEKGVPQAGPITDDFPPGEPIASDDTEATVNHAGRWVSQGGMTVLFFDSHVEFFTDDRLDPTDAVGKKGGLLWRLRN
jgi:prepilin-type processing-associated H-X9-DG protein